MLSRAIWTILGICVLTVFASAQVRTMTYDGVLLDEPVLIQFGEVMLRVPAGYLAPWPRPDARNRVNKRGRIAFNFWMPSRRYVEIDEASLAGFQPKERGREPSLPGTYVVKVLEMRLLTPDELDHRSPEKRFRNLTSLAGLTAYSFQEEGFGLVRFWRHDWPYELPEPFLHYRHKEGGDPQILLRCTPPHRASPGKVCDGYVYVEADQLSFYIVFDRDDLSKWRENVRAAQDLFRSWQTVPP